MEHYFISPASQRSGILNPWIWLANRSLQRSRFSHPHPEYAPIRNFQLQQLSKPFGTVLKSRKQRKMETFRTESKTFSISRECVLLWFEAHYSTWFQAGLSFIVNINFCRVKGILHPFTTIQKKKINALFTCLGWSVLGKTVSEVSSMTVNEGDPRRANTQILQYFSYSNLTLKWFASLNNSNNRCRHWTSLHGRNLNIC